MPTPAEKLKDLQDQVTAKVHWDTPDHEVADWLEEKHGLTEEQIDEMLRIAHKKRRMAIRERAIYLMIGTGIGIAVFGAYIWFDEQREELVHGKLRITSRILLGVSIVAFLRGLQRFISGKTDATIDP